MSLEKRRVECRPKGVFRHLQQAGFRLEALELCQEIAPERSSRRNKLCLLAAKASQPLWQPGHGERWRLR